MYENRYLDNFINSLEEADYKMDKEMKEKILKITHEKIRRKWMSIRNIAAACVLFAALASFIPNTPVYALRQKLFSFIPGVGVVQSDSEDTTIRSVLGKPVKLVDGETFAEVKTAYIKGNSLIISAITNAGAVGAGKFEDPKEFKEFFAGETAPQLYLIDGENRIKPGQVVWGGPSLETRVYTMQAFFRLSEEDNEKGTFKLEIEGIKGQLQIALSPVKSNYEPEDMGNTAVVDNVMLFADISRQGSLLQVLLSSVAPNTFKNVRMHLFDDEKSIFESGIYLMDSDGVRYEEDEGLRKQNNGSYNTFFFNVPEHKKGLRLVVPQILYNKEYKERNIKIYMPKPGKNVVINKELNLGETILMVETASVVTAQDPLLPDEFRNNDCMRMDISVKPAVNSRETILRAWPQIEVPHNVFGYLGVSYSTYAQLWGSKQQSGYSLTYFDDMHKTKKIMLNFNIQCAMTGPWEIEIAE